MHLISGVPPMKNRAYHAGIRRSPYDALFGSKVEVGLSTSRVPQDILENIVTEEELDDIVNTIEESENEFEELFPNMNLKYKSKITFL